MHPALLLSATDGPFSKSFREHQQKCMATVIGYEDAALTDACAWQFIICDEDGFVRSIESIPEQRTFCIAFLPSTVRHIDLSYTGVNSSVQSDQLPRELRHCRMEKCGIPGTLNLERLPRMLEVLTLRSNFIHGEISLLALPNHIEMIDLSNNPIDFVSVDSALLPHSLTKAQFSKKTKRAKLKLIDIGDVPVSKKIVALK